MSDNLSFLVKKYNLTFEKVSDYKSILSNENCTIEFLKERYEDGFVVIIETPIKRLNFYEFIKHRCHKEEFKDYDSNDFDQVANFVINKCNDVLIGVNNALL